MIDIFSMSELTMLGLVLFSSFWIFLFNYRTDHKEKYADKPESEQELYVKVLPKKLDEEVASLMVEGFGGVVTKLTQNQADYINVPKDGPFKEEEYKY